MSAEVCGICGLEELDWHKCTICNGPKDDPDRRHDAKRNGDVPEFWENWPHDDE